MTLAFRCALCDRKPRWSILRYGDAVQTWACVEHLGLVLDDLLPTDEHRDQALITDMANTWKALNEKARSR